ncbi:MAG TPA: hypothetical protein VE823_06765, partial [Geodermatophilus sp.]|nr:hypothetical protein [Geodermatophilus sp.]
MTDALTRCLGGRRWFRRRQQPSLTRSVGLIPRLALEAIKGVSPSVAGHPEVPQRRRARRDGGEGHGEVEHR